ncbi:beta-lactamase-like protein [Suillus subaureus]|uniref:Beta-lactamase-like protein n=1 Tax=Suillus subaureus TaxID=48587 RepID=A0A9P7JJY7_9AGAM|nr:beta-lactamase-like protein [Suillus subaureus]KAG1826258.1 beta-lactamase-like protein [Suillus subaureus]
MGSIVSPSNTPPIELLFLGTGTSSSIPHLDCLTAPPNREPCLTCLSTLTPEGKKNIRRNTSAALRISGKDGKTTTVVIDVGKNFQAAAVEWFPKYGLREIDAVIITHAHADAMNGLDDLRGWTLGGAIQTHIDVYVSLSTFHEVQRSFPYLVSKEFASGGGDVSCSFVYSVIIFDMHHRGKQVPDFEWHIIEDKVPFEIKDTGVQITPFIGWSSPVRPLSGTCCSNAPPKIHPYLCFGFLIQDTIIYISDVSLIPDDTWALLESAKKPMPVLVLDCLRLRSHMSHMGIQEAVAAVRRLNPSRTYLTGFSHDISHDEYVTIGKAAGGDSSKDTTHMSIVERRGTEMIREGKPVWIRPSYDGLRVFVSNDDSVIDETYD